MNPKKAKRRKRAMSTPSLLLLLLLSSAPMLPSPLSSSLALAAMDCWSAWPDKSAAPKITPAVTLLTRRGEVSNAER